MSAPEHSFFLSFPFKFILSRSSKRARACRINREDDTISKKTEKMTRMPRLEPVSGSTGGSYGNSGREATSSLYSSATSSYIRFPLSCGHATIYKPEKRIQRGERMRTPHHVQARWYRAHDRHRLCRGIWPMQSVSFKKTDYLAL
jgi:hypothetical protein